MKRLMNVVPKNISIAKVDKIPNQTQTHCAPKEKYRSSLPSICKVLRGCSLIGQCSTVDAMVPFGADPQFVNKVDFNSDILEA